MGTKKDIRVDSSKEARQSVGHPREVRSEEGRVRPVGVVTDAMERHGAEETKVHDDQSQHKTNWSVEVTEGQHGCKEGEAWKEEGEEPVEPWRPAEVVGTGPLEKLFNITVPG